MSTQKQLQERIIALESTLRQARDFIAQNRAQTTGAKSYNFQGGVHNRQSCREDLIKNSGYSAADAASQCLQLYPYDTAPDGTKNASINKKLSTIYSYQNHLPTEKTSQTRNASSNTYPAWLKTHDYLFGEYVPQHSTSVKSASSNTDSRPTWLKVHDYSLGKRLG